MPTFSNPRGSLLSALRREELVRLALEYDFLIVEDDPYGELTFGDHMIEPLFAVGRRMAGAANPVLYLSSLSKTVAPALRIGWMVVPEQILRRCSIAKQTADLCTSPMASRSQRTICARVGSLLRSREPLRTTPVACTRWSMPNRPLNYYR